MTHSHAAAAAADDDDWLIDWWIDWWMDWLIDWLMDWLMIDGLIDWWIDWLIDVNGAGWGEEHPTSSLWRTQRAARSEHHSQRQQVHSLDRHASLHAGTVSTAGGCLLSLVSLQSTLLCGSVVNMQEVHQANLHSCSVVTQMSEWWCRGRESRHNCSCVCTAVRCEDVKPDYIKAVNGLLHKVEGCAVDVVSNSVHVNDFSVEIRTTSSSLIIHS